jgi:hypothetical protein
MAENKVLVVKKTSDEKSSHLYFDSFFQIFSEKTACVYFLLGKLNGQKYFSRMNDAAIVKMKYRLKTLLTKQYNHI